MTDPTHLREQQLPGEVPRYELPGWRQRFGVVAGITGKGGGGRGFDLGLGGPAPVGQVMERWDQFRHAVPGFYAWIMGKQVHGTAVRWYDQAEGWVRVDATDGHATRRAGTLLMVSAADCVPVYLVAPKAGAVALLHAGWRGASAGILDRGVGQLIDRAGARPEDMAMHCGIGICGQCYQVGSDVLQAFGLRGDGPGPWHLDLRERLARRALTLGIAEVSLSEWCTAHDRPGFMSHRASRGRDGRMVAYLGFPEGGAGGEADPPG